MLDAWLLARVLAHVEAPQCRLVCAHWNQQLRSKVLRAQTIRAQRAYDLHAPQSAERVLAADRRFLLEFLQSDRRMMHFGSTRAERWQAWAACFRLGISVHRSMIALYK